MNEGGAPIRPEAPPCLLHGLNKCATGFTLSVLVKLDGRPEKSEASKTHMKLRGIVCCVIYYEFSPAKKNDLIFPAFSNPAAIIE